MEDTKFHHLRFLSGKMWFIFGTNCLFDGITIFKFEAKLCFWAQNVEVCWCSVCFYFVCFRFGGRFVIYFFFLIAAVCLLWRECWFMFSSLLSFICCLFGSMRVFIYLFVCITQIFFPSSTYLFCSLYYPVLYHSLHCLLFYSPKPSHTNRILIHFLFFDFMSFFSHFIL